VPPSMRQSSEEERLNRQVRGLLNRLAQSNLHSVGTQLLTIYNDNSDIRTSTRDTAVRAHARTRTHTL
jgi:hypothetical protein